MQYVLLLVTLLVILMMLWVIQSDKMMKEEFEDVRLFCPDNRFKTFDRRGCNDGSNVNRCTETVKQGWRADIDKCEGILPKKFCPDVNFFEFNFEGCNNPTNKESCLNSLKPDFIADESLCKNRVPKSFCPDPRFQEFDKNGCSNTQNLDSCVKSVNQGFTSNENLCRIRKPIPFCPNDKFIEFEYEKDKVCRGNPNCMKVCKDPNNIQKCNQFIAVNQCGGNYQCIEACNDPKLVNECYSLRQQNKDKKSGGFIASNDGCKTLKTPVCDDFTRQNFNPQVCSNHRDCANTMGPTFIADTSKCGMKVVAKDFCPLPNYVEFNPAGCALPTSADNCKNTVNYGFSADETKCNNLIVNPYRFMDPNFQVKMIKPIIAPQVKDDRPQWAIKHA